MNWRTICVNSSECVKPHSRLEKIILTINRLNFVILSQMQQNSIWLTFNRYVITSFSTFYIFQVWKRLKALLRRKFLVIEPAGHEIVKDHRYLIIYTPSKRITVIFRETNWSVKRRLEKWRVRSVCPWEIFRENMAACSNDPPLECLICSETES